MSSARLNPQAVRGPRLRRTAAALAAAVVIAACTGGGGGEAALPRSETPAERVHTGGTITIGAEQWPDCINPVTQCATSAWLVWTTAIHTLPQLMETDAHGGYRTSPLLAEEPTMANGGITLDPFRVRFRLAPQAVWDDGTPITSKDVEFSWRAKLDTTDSVSKVGYDQVESVDASDPHTAVVTFTTPLASWRDFLGGAADFVLKASAFASTNIGDDLQDHYPFSGGPWRLASWSNEQAVLTPNPLYWAPERRPLVDKVVFVPRDDTDTELASLLAGEVDAIYPQAAAGIAQKLSRPEISHRFGQLTQYEGMWLQTASPPLDDRNVREALAFSIDRQKVLEVIMRPAYPEAEVLNCGLWVPTVGRWCDQGAFADLTYDPARAERLLNASGWRKNQSGFYEKNGEPLALRWMVNSGNSRRESLQALVIPALEKLGWKITTDNVDAATMFEQRLPSRDFQLATYIASASPDPRVSDLLHCRAIPTEESPSGQNVMSWCNEEASALMDASDRELDEAARIGQVHRLAALVRAELPFLPLYQFPALTAWRNDRLAGPIDADTSNPASAFASLHNWSIRR
ncbi:MAG: peptide ABC transporter substrate-binding protein [Acidimicrobiales bacterium]